MKNEIIMRIWKETITPYGNINESLKQDIEHKNAGMEEYEL